MNSHAVGIDLSYTSTGIAAADRCVDTYSTNPTDTDIERARLIAGHILAHVYPGDLVCIEAGIHRSHYAFRAGLLHGIVRHTLKQDRPTAHVTLIAPKTLKMFATGRGNADKTTMVVAARDRLQYDGTQNDEADALWLQEIGNHLNGAPTVTLPQTHLRALDKVTR